MADKKRSDRIKSAIISVSLNSAAKSMPLIGGVYYILFTQLDTINATSQARSHKYNMSTR